MIISNINTKYLKLDSETIATLTANPSGYTSIQITASINCCQEEGSLKTYEDTLDLTKPIGYYLDLNDAVNESQDLVALNFFNSISQLVYNALGSSPIDLGLVLLNCLSEDCTLETSADNYATTFKTAIDGWFSTLGITSDVSVSFAGNIMFLSALPTNFSLITGVFGSEETPIVLDSVYINGTIGSFLSGNSLFLTAKLFDLVDLTDGIYKVTVRLNKTTGHTIESNCAFVDITVRCQVAGHLKGLLAVSSRKKADPVSTIVHLLHYALTNDSNCGCNCDDMCKGYKELICLLNNFKTSSDCGC